ncbi:MAG TPA: hypothetical protein VFQ35_05955 [Polyangiaceae bacterium]|nr:hypothetical protein [Polyangiaceae bacterium]
MTIERRNPLPRAVYWQDVFTPAIGEHGGTIEEFRAWASAHKNAVLIRQTVYHGPGADPFAELIANSGWVINPLLAKLAADAAAAPDFGRSRLWALFEVREPVPWDAIKFGYPTIAERGTETTEGDTVTKPPPEPDAIDRVDDAIDSAIDSAKDVAKTTGSIVGVLALAAGALLFFNLLAASRTARAR